MNKTKYNRGFFGIGVIHTKNSVNIGTLWRSASIMGASFIFTIGRRYKTQPSDTMKSWKHIPLYNYDTFDSFYEHMPKDCRLVGVELDERSIDVRDYVHPERAIYLLGAEDSGIPNVVMNRCHDIIQLPGEYCMNVSVAGSIAMYDRIYKL